MRCPLALVPMLALAGCHLLPGDHGGHAGHGAPPPVRAVEPWAGPWDVPRLEDTNPDPDTVEVTLVAAPAERELLPGKKAMVWAYNGSVPGPLIEAKVGDRLVVRFRNELPEPTTIHWHGLRIPAEMDGVPGHSQPQIPPGGSFEYVFTVPDAGLFWYHPHVRSDVQVERGLYGPLVVRGPGEPSADRERLLVLDDVLVDEEGALVQRSPSPHEIMLGRQGTLLLVNGRPRPVATVQAGAIERWRLVNAANARYFRLALPGHRFQVVGVDGGLMEAAQEAEELLMVPGERLDLLVRAAGQPGSALDLQTLPYDRGHGTGGGASADVLRVVYAAEALPERPMPRVSGEVGGLAGFRRSRRLALTEEMHGSGRRAPVFRINGEAFPKVTPLEARLGDTELWEVANDSDMDHPFHLHGFRFQVLPAAGAAPAPRAWKDTVNVPARATVRLGVQFEGHPGAWMFHCHILEHAEHGMMGMIHVAP